VLAATGSVHAPDLPGWGRSDTPAYPLTLPELADTLVRWMDVVGIETATLLGNSMGCQIVTDFALRHPRRLERAVLVGPTVDPYARSALRQSWRVTLDATREKPSEVLITIRDYVRFGVRRGVVTGREALADPIVTELTRLTAPTLIVRGERDAIVSQRWAEDAARLLPFGELRVMQGAPHAVNYHLPEELADTVLAFIAATPAGSVAQRPMTQR
jgi:2-hydroxy-6-oxonona-2,4-dienedioate hydrolase